MNTDAEHKALVIIDNAVRELYHTTMRDSERNPYTDRTAFETLCHAHAWIAMLDPAWRKACGYRSFEQACKAVFA